MIDSSFQSFSNNIGVAILALNDLNPFLSTAISKFEENNATKLQLGHALMKNFDKSRRIRSEVSNMIAGTYEMKWHSKQLHDYLNLVYQNDMSNRYPANLILHSNYLYNIKSIQYNISNQIKELFDTLNNRSVFDNVNSSQIVTDILTLAFHKHEDMIENITFTLGRIFNDFVDYEEQYMNEIAEYTHAGRPDRHFFL